MPTEVVDPTVDEYALTAPSGQPDARLDVERAPLARGKAGVLSDPTVTSLPEPVVGYGAVGVTWAPGTDVPGMTSPCRCAPGPARRGRAGCRSATTASTGRPGLGGGQGTPAPAPTPLLVGDVDLVQVRGATTERSLPADLRLAVVDPGRAARSAMEKPALDTTTMDGTPGDATMSAGAPASLATDPGEGTDGSDRIDLQAATFTPKPQIFSRAQWGADEQMREKSSLHYGEVHAGLSTTP